MLKFHGNVVFLGLRSYGKKIYIFWNLSTKTLADYTSHLAVYNHLMHNFLNIHEAPLPSYHVLWNLALYKSVLEALQEDPCVHLNQWTIILSQGPEHWFYM